MVILYYANIQFPVLTSSIFYWYYGVVDTVAVSSFLRSMVR